jgi:hypothetical protein
MTRDGGRGWRGALADDESGSAGAPAGGLAPGKRTLTQRLVQRRAGETDRPPVARPVAAPVAAGAVGAVPGGLADAFTEGIHGAAQAGVQGPGSSLPHLETIQRAFGEHDVGGVRAHVGGDAAAACADIGATAYATGQDVAFARQPDLHLAAHEAAHVVQQRGGVQLAGGVGQRGDPFEQHADAVADAVVRGESAEALLGAHAPAAAGAAMVQRNEGDLRLTMPTLGDSLHRPQPPRLFAPGELTLHLTPPSAADLIRPTDAMLDALARSWVNQFRVGAGPADPPPGLQPAPGAAPGDPLQQLLTQWRRLVAEWVARGAPGVMNPELAREELLGPAARAVPPTFTTGDIPGKVWDAFRAALEATQFYQQLRTRAEELAATHWPFIVIALGTALGTAVTMGVHGNDWRAMAILSERLTAFARADIPLGTNVRLQLALEDSHAIRPSEQGVVIGLSPSVGVRWQIGEGASLSIQSRANMRFLTGQGTGNGFGFDWTVTPLNVLLSF